MTAAASTVALRRSARPLPFRLARAELLKVRKRRGLVATAVLLTVAAVVILEVAMELFHLSNPVKYSAAGGGDHFRRAMFLLSQLGSVAAALVGASLGADDVSAGVFRDLVATGRSRAALFAARIPGGLAMVWPLTAAAFTIACLFTVGLAGGKPTPDTTLFVESGLWVELAVGLAFALGLGLGSVISSRAQTVSILFGWIVIVEPLLTRVTALATGREWLLSAGVDRLAPAGILPARDRVAMSLGVAVAVTVAWALVPLAAGLWRTRTRDA